MADEASTTRVALVAASGANPPEVGGPLSRSGTALPAVGVVEVIYRVEPLELVRAILNWGLWIQILRRFGFPTCKGWRMESPRKCSFWESC